MTYRVFLSLMVLAGFTALHSSAWPQSAKLDDLLKCQSIISDTDRLACFDEKVGAFSDAAKSGEIVAVEKETIKDIERDSFGFNLPSIPRLSRLFGVKPDSRQSETSEDVTAPVAENVGEAESVVADTNQTKVDEDRKKDRQIETNETKNVTLEIKRVRSFNSGKLRFLFSNGQIWEQTDSRSLPKIKLKDGRIVTAEITKGAWGSFFLRVNGKGTAIKVRRTR